MSLQAFEENLAPRARFELAANRLTGGGDRYIKQSDLYIIRNSKKVILK
jgi:hypothetical protein